MRKLIIIIISGLICFMESSFIYASDKMNTHTTISEGKEVKEKGKLVSSKYLCNEKCTFHPETQHISDSGEKIYKKRVDVKRTIEEVSKENQPRANLSLNVIFTYDKKSFVKVEQDDFKNYERCKFWKLKNISEIRPDKSVCLVSDRYIIYKKGSIGVGSHLMEGHVDVMCSLMGDIGLNTNLS